MNRRIHGVQQFKFGSDGNPKVVRAKKLKAKGFVNAFLPIAYCELCLNELRDKLTAIDKSKLKGPSFRVTPVYDCLLRQQPPLIPSAACGKVNRSANLRLQPRERSITAYLCPIHFYPYAVNFSNVSTGAVTIWRSVSTNRSERFRRLKRKVISSR